LAYLEMPLPLLYAFLKIVYLHRPPLSRAQLEPGTDW